MRYFNLAPKQPMHCGGVLCLKRFLGLLPSQVTVIDCTHPDKYNPSVCLGSPNARNCSMWCDGNGFRCLYKCRQYSCKEGEHVKENITSDSESQGLVKIIRESDIIKNSGLTTPKGQLNRVSTLANKQFLLLEHHVMFISIWTIRSGGTLQCVWFVLWFSGGNSQRMLRVGLEIS